ncbi:glucosaminidase domain-containing protein [Cohnella sp. REN36]|uniref:glucosaminidase domain-containing protein n=1 Tax=Cohnella sp. REN36 TaxID=2887347 RepID=UPI001D15743A|nr:glucosaminidase domain-containing protein [Cohnella sp. REN36]MCC3371647.1 glucosaminidase domain-containing protein [Cohnella sp. REN36]
MRRFVKHYWFVCMLCATLLLTLGMNVQPSNIVTERTFAAEAVSAVPVVAVPTLAAANGQTPSAPAPNWAASPSDATEPTEPAAFPDASVSSPNDSAPADTLPAPQQPAPGTEGAHASDDLDGTTSSPVPSPAPSPAILPTYDTYEVTAYFLNVRANPYAKSKILDVVSRGTLLEVVGKSDEGWLRLRGEGYVHGGYAKLVSAADASSPATAKDSKAAVNEPKATVNDPKSTDKDPKSDEPPQPKLKVGTGGADASAKTGGTKTVPGKPAPKPQPLGQPNKPTSAVKSDSGLTAEHIATILKGTALANIGLEDAILEIEEEYGINAYFTIAVMKLESGNGKSKLAKTKNNLFGLNAVTGSENVKAFSFSSKEDSIRKFGQLLAKNYVGKGYTTIEKVAKKYCPASGTWATKVKNIMASDHRKI